MTPRACMRLLMLSLFAILFPALLGAQPLTGTKIVKPSGGDYASLSAAIADVNSKGVSGTLTLLIDADLSETGSPEITSTTLTGSNRLVIKPNTGKTPTITFTAVATSGNNGNTCLAVTGSTTNVGNITIDGSNTASGTTRDMTISLSDTTNGRYGIRLNGETDNVTIKNLKIVATAIKRTTASGSRTYGIYGVATTAGAADSLRVINCEIGSSVSAFYFGIYKPDGGTLPTGAGLVISGNVVYAQHKGISVWGSSGVASIDANTLSVIGHPTGTYVHSSLNGIYLETWLGTVNISNNKIVTLKAKAVSQTALRPLYGIIVYNVAGTGSPAGQTANIYNNFISDFSYTGDASTASSGIEGIAIDAGDQTVNVYYNTIYLNQTASNPTAGIRVYDDAGLSAHLKNNIIVNTVNHDSAYAVYCSPTANNCLKSSDYNNLFVAGANANIGIYNAAKQKSLANWQAASGKDAQSKNLNPANPFGGPGQLTSATNLHWVSPPTTAWAGTPIPGYTTDIDGDARNATTPYMGADEAGPLTGVALTGEALPFTFGLEQNFPNPFNPGTVITYSVPVEGQVSLRVYDLLGRAVAILVDQRQAAGQHTVRFDGIGLSSGTYIYRLSSGDRTESRRMQLLK